jgi:hypothetical protein
VKTITRNEYLKMVGLLGLAGHHNRALRDIVKALREITGEEEEVGGHTDDAVWGDEDAEYLLTRLQIEVEGGIPFA